jgi:hypothetical protein
MSNVKRLTLIIFGLITCHLLMLSQLSAESSQVKTAYDKTKNETTESLRLMTVMEKPGTIEARFPGGSRNLPSEILRMTAYFTYPGRTLVKPESVMLGFLSIVQGEAKYKDTDEVTVRVDGQSLSIGKLHVADRQIDTQMELKDVDYWRETLEVSLKTPEFLRIANARKVTVQLGNTQFDLSAEHIKSLRVLASRVGP